MGSGSGEEVSDADLVGDRTQSTPVRNRIVRPRLVSDGIEGPITHESRLRFWIGSTTRIAERLSTDVLTNGHWAFGLKTTIARIVYNFLPTFATPTQNDLWVRF